MWACGRGVAANCSILRGARLVHDSVTDPSGTLVIELSDQADEWVIADAVLIQFVAPTGQGLRAARTRALSRAGAGGTPR